MKKLGFLSNRYLLLGFVILLASAIMIIRLYDMQIIRGDEYFQQSTKKITHKFAIKAPRGLILDRNGLPIAYNRESNNIYLTKVYSSDEQLNESLLQLNLIFEENGEKYLHSFDKYVLGDPVIFNDNHTIEEIIEWQMNEDLLNISEGKVKNSAKELILLLRSDKHFNIDEKYSDEEAYRIICMRYEILKNRWNYIMGGRIPIASDVSVQTIALISEQRHNIQGVIIQKKMVREYGDVMDLGQVLGYVGVIPIDRLNELVQLGYNSNDFIGRSGIEEYAESYLHGTDGYFEYEADQRTGRLLEQIGGYDEIPGNDVTLTIDMGLQKIAMEALKDTIAEIAGKYDGKINYGDASAGAVVVMDVKTGEVLVMASYPSYDPKWFIHNDEESQEKRLDAIFDEYGKPMFNRALQGVYTPGSTYKPIVAIAALEAENSEYDALSEIVCEGHFTSDNWEYFCHRYIESRGSHGSITISEGIETSCNIVFHKLGLDVGIDEIDKWAEQFGFGQPTGIDLFGEAVGIRSNPEYKYSRFDEKWWPADTGQSSIGQLYNNFTPLQMVVYTAALANGGEKLTPYVIKEVTSPSGETIYKGGKSFEKMTWSDETYAIVQEGMNNVTLDGTASKVFEDDYPISVAAKTGTAETGHEAEESSNALFICYAPVENPQIAIVTVIENGVWGSYAAPVAKEILNAYFGIER